MRTAILALLLGIGAAAAALAQTAEKEVTPAEAFAKAISARAEPSSDAAFAFEGEMKMEDHKLGTYRFAAEAVEEDGKNLWLVTDTGRMSFGTEEFFAETRAWLDARLSAVRGDEKRKENGEKSSARFSCTEKGYVVFEQRGEDEETRTEVAAPDGLLSNVAGALLFARAVPAEAVAYGFRTLNLLSDDGELVEEVHLRAKGAGEWNGKAALLFHRRDGKRDVTFALDPETRDLLGMRMSDPDGMTVEFVPGTVKEEPAEEGPLTPPARDAKTCALIAALAYGSGDGELLASIADWPSIVADLRARHPDREYDEEALRKRVVASLNGYQGKQSRETVLPVILAMTGSVKVTEEGDRATVVFPPAFQNLTIHVGRFGDEWRMVALPGT